MGAVNWTDDQRRVLEAQGSIIVSAAAGSGKTAVLTERIVRLCASGVELKEMLVVTYTKAAAADMKQRIEKKLMERSGEEDDPRKRRFLYEQAVASSDANISTLHSFCAHVLKKHFFEAGITSAFRIGDEAELKELLTQAGDEALDFIYDNEPEAVKLPNMFGGEDVLLDTANEILTKVRSRGDGFEWLSCAVENYRLSEQELEDTEIVKNYLASIYECIYMAYVYSQEAAQYTTNEKLEQVVAKRTEHLQSILENPCSYSELALKLGEALCSFRGTRGSTDELKQVNKYTDEQYKAAQEMMVDLTYMMDMQKRSYPYMKLLQLLVEKIDELFREKKQRKGIIDFSDLELYTLKVLREDNIAKIYREKFKHIFVDEYQDINPLQDEIIKIILREDNAFFVGDVKQSIYRFRNAKPTLFLDKMKEYERLDTANSLNLSANFRSSSAVIDFANSVFSTLMTPHTCGIAYDENTKLVKLGEAGEGNVRIHFIENRDRDLRQAEDSDLEEILSENAQAVLAVNEIKRMVNTKFYDAQNKVEREFCYNDFAIIMRSIKSKGNAFARELMLAGIPVYMEATDGYFEAIEVQILINLLSIVDNRRQDIPLLSVMRSVIGDFSMDEITSMRIAANTEAVDGKNYDMLDVLSFAAEACGNKKAEDFLDKLNRWKRLSLYESLTDFVQSLLIETGYERFINALPGGKRRGANLERFLMLCAQYEANANKGLSDFLQYIESAKLGLELGSPQEAATDAVKIITMHKSKGLEYNVVIVPNIERGIVTIQPSISKLLYDDQPYIGAKLVIDGKLYENLYYLMLKEKELHSIYTDEIRLLYVAFTRARDTLILLSTTKETNKLFYKTKIAAEHPNLGVFHVCKKYVDWITMALQSDNDLYNKCRQLIEDGSCHGNHLSIFSTPMYLYGMGEQDIDRQHFINELDDMMKINTDEFDADMNREYPFAQATTLTSKGSVTGFVKSETVISYQNANTDMQHSTISAAQRGTATHSVFEKMPLKEHDIGSVKSYIRHMQDQGLLTDDEVQSLNIEGIAAFYSRPLYARMLRSECVLREQEFTCMVEARRLLSDNDSEEQIMVQGIIDCCFKENGKWIILDYKTDRVNRYDQEAVVTQANNHKKQLSLYAHVLEKISGIPVAECYICFVNAFDVKVEI